MHEKHTKWKTIEHREKKLVRPEPVPSTPSNPHVTEHTTSLYIHLEKKYQRIKEKQCKLIFLIQ